MKRFKVFSLFFVLFAILIGCEVEEGTLQTNNYSNTEYDILSSQLNLPLLPFNYLLGNIGTPIEVDHKATLGRVLFYDNNLSADGKISCASCHQQSLAFADNKAFSDGVNNNKTKRNSIALGSLKSFGIHYNNSVQDVSPGLFWDERAQTVKEQLKQTINNPHEMGVDLEDISDLMESTDYYQILYEKAFGSSKVLEDDILEALEVFINSISSPSTKLENEMLQNLNYINGDSITGTSNFSEGLKLFQSHCNNCHGVNISLPLEVNEQTAVVTIANNGLKTANEDFGAFMHTQIEDDKGKFKIPGLRNIELTAPYMHDGRFSSLEEVVEFYNSGINYQANLHHSLKNGEKAKQLNLTENDKTVLVQFLKSLTDANIATEEKWSNPFLD